MFSIINSAGNPTKRPPAPTGVGGRLVCRECVCRAACALWWVVLIGTIIGSLSPQSSDSVGRFRDAHDGLLHAACYGALTSLRALESRRRQLWSLIACFTLGVAIEFFQPTVGRAFDLADIIANTAGLLSGYLAAIGVSALNADFRENFDSA